MTWIAKPQMATYAAETGVAVGSDAKKTSGAYTKCGRKSAVLNMPSPGTPRRMRGRATP